MEIVKINSENWESFLKLSVKDEQKDFVPSPAEAMAAGYVKPWDEALDVYGLMKDEQAIGLFYISYTPESKDNYWLGGFFIDLYHQGKGYGKEALGKIIEWFKFEFPMAGELWLTVEADNNLAKGLYESFAFVKEGTVNKYGEEKYYLKLVDNNGS